MAKLPAREKVNVLCFRRSSPDEILIVQREVKRAMQWGVPFAEVVGESAREEALDLVSLLVRGDPLADFDLGGVATYRVKSGPRAGDWTERFHAVEVAPEARATGGRWAAHYDAKAMVGGETPRVREAITRLREAANLKP